MEATRFVLSVSPATLVQVRILGPLEISRRLPNGSWQAVERQEWGQGTPPRSVFKRLLTTPGRRLSRLDIQEDLWPGAGMDLADRYLNNAVMTIRKVIGRDLAETIGGTLYAIAGQSQVWTDLDACKLLLKQAENQGCTTPEALPFLEEMHMLFERGKCLEDEGERWCHAVRADAESMARQCYLWLAEGYEKAGKLWQAGTIYRAMVHTLPLNEEALFRWMEMLGRQNKSQEALMQYENAKKNAEEQGYTLSANIEQLVMDLRFALKSRISRRSALAIFSSAASLSVTGETITGLFPDELLGVYASGIKACRQLLFNGKTVQVALILPLYREQLTRLASTSSPLQKAAAALCSQVWQLQNSISCDAEDFGAAYHAASQALLYAQIAGDVDLQLVAVVKAADTHFHRKQPGPALALYDQYAQSLFKDASPCLRGRAYAGIAELYGMQERKQEALTAMGLAYDSYAAAPQDDSAPPYLHPNHYSLYVFGDAQTRLFLRQPEEASRVLDYVEKHIITPQEPLRLVDLCYYQAQVQAQLGQIEATCSLLMEAALLAKQLGTRLYQQKLSNVATSLRAAWPNERHIIILEEMYQL